MTKSEALRYRGAIEMAAQSLPDETALTVVSLHPKWATGAECFPGYKVQRLSKVWRCLQSHTAQAGWEPENAPALWSQLDETHAGTLADPIPYSGNMALTAGLYYSEEGVTYRCTRDTVNPVYNPLSALVGLYVELA